MDYTKSMDVKKVVVGAFLGIAVVGASAFLALNVLAHSGKEMLASPQIAVEPGAALSDSLAIQRSGAGFSGPVAKTGPNENIKFGAKRLINNFWGAPPEEKLSGGVYFNEDKSVGWYWDRPHPLTKPGTSIFQPIYQNVRTGGCPWETSGTPLFPIKFRDIKTLEFDSAYRYLIPPSGTYNLSYDMFLSDTDKTSATPSPKVEIMIWLQHTFGQPPDKYKGDVSDGINTYEYYSYTLPNGRLYYAFVLKDQTPLNGEHIVNAKKLMDTLGLDPSWYLHGVELGNEVVNGSGKIEIIKNDVILNGDDLSI
jgi:hypothetical protein